MDGSRHMKQFKTLLAATAVASLPVVASGQGAASEEAINSIITSLAPTVQPPVIAEDAPLPERGSANDILTTPVPSAPGTTVIVQQAPQTIIVQTPLELRLGADRIVIDTSRAIDVEVYFGYDSAELTLEARTDLRALGMALRSPELIGYSYLIGGHTDASGDASYNHTLSERRAAAVRDFLLREYAVDPSRLIAIGFGEDRPRTPETPYAAINRRVEVALIVTEYVAVR